MRPFDGRFITSALADKPPDFGELSRAVAPEISGWNESLWAATWWSEFVGLESQIANDERECRANA